MKVHALVIKINKNHAIPSAFQVEQYWDINTITDFNNVIKTLRKRTYKDRLGRILAYGTPATNKGLQKRLYVVKRGMGANTAIWDNVTPQGELVKYNLKRGIV